MPQAFELKDEFKNITEFTVPKLTKVKAGEESGTTTVKQSVFIARAEKYIELGFGHYFKNGREIAKEAAIPAPPMLIIKHKNTPKAKKAAELAKKANAGNFDKVLVKVK